MLAGIVIPVLNESAGIEVALAALQPLRETGTEIIVVDGGSTDDSVRVSHPASGYAADECPRSGTADEPGRRTRALSSAAIFKMLTPSFPKGQTS